MHRIEFWSSSQAAEAEKRVKYVNCHLNFTSKRKLNRKKWGDGEKFDKEFV